MSPDIWDLSISADNHLHFGGCDLFGLARTHGTPLHVVSEEKLLGNLHALREAFFGTAPDVRFFYSYKTNCVPGVLGTLHREGCGAEVVSGYELWLALQLGVPPEDIVFNGVIKSRGDLETAIEAGIGMINIDSTTEAALIQDIASSAGRQVKLGLRVYPRAGWRGQFGLEPDGHNIVDLVARLSTTEYCRITGLHAHVGSGLLSTDTHRFAAKSLCSLARRIEQDLNVPIRHINLGGGFGVPSVKTLSIPEVACYKLFNRSPRPPDVQTCPSFGDFATAVGDVFQAVYGERSARPGLMLEPGRAVSSSAQLLLVTIRDIKKRNDGRTYAIADGGMQNIAFPLSYEYHHCFVVNRATAPFSHRYYVAGPLCSPEDILYHNWPLPELSAGDVLAIMDSGAYFTSFANSFSLPRPAVAIVSKGESRIIHQRETFEQMVAGGKPFISNADIET